MVATAQAAASEGPARKLGFAAGQIVQELGYDDDVDEGLRLSLEAVVGSELEAGDFDGVADAVLLWWREGDGDLTDDVVDALTALAEGGNIVLVTPKVGRDQHVDASDIEEAALTAGLHASGSVNVGADWTGTRLVAPKTARR